jgi:hypothetical protein
VARAGNRALREAKREARDVAQRLIGPRETRGERALLGAAVLGTAALGTAMVMERREVAHLMSDGIGRTARLGRALAIATGMRRRPMYVRMLPGAGIATGLIAAVCATYLVTTRLMASRRGFDLERMRPAPDEGGVWNPMDPMEPPDPPPRNPAPGRGNPNDHV